MARQGGRLSLCAEALIAPNHPPQSHRPGGPSGPPTPLGPLPPLSPLSCQPNFLTRSSLLRLPGFLPTCFSCTLCGLVPASETCLKCFL